jgi:hypothetical protein
MASLGLLISLLSALVAMVSAAIAWYNTFSLRQQATSEALVGCLNIYISIREKRWEAKKQKDEDLAKEYFGRLTDLCWTELRLYQSNLIPYHVFYAWMDSRYRSYNGSDGILVGSGRTEKVVSHHSVWNELVSKQYFSQHDDFLPFMNDVHDGKIKEAIQKYKNPKLH